MALNTSQIEDVFAATDEDIKTLLSNILNLNLENESSVKGIIGSINRLLSVSKSRLQGLEFLNLIISNCLSTTISENAFTWISHCLIKHPGDNLKEIKLSTIGKIVENVYSEQEFTKKFISEYISKVLEMCLSSHENSHEAEAALDTLTICMRRYGSWFAPHKMKIESFLINFLENSSETLVESAAAAFHYLQQVGGAGTDGINHKTNFSTNFDKLCATIQKLFDKFFENETEIDHSNRNRSDEEGFEFIDLPHYSQKMLHITARRIRNCLKFAMTMLLKAFPVVKGLKPRKILDIIDRGTAIHHCVSMGNEKSLEDFQFSLLLNKIQVQLVQFLRIFIIWGQTNLLPFSFNISKILIDCLTKTQNCRCFKTDSVYQELIYKVLSCWLRICKSSVHVHFQTQLVTCILKDITAVKNPVTLTLQSDIPKHKSTKAKRKAIQERIVSSGQVITSTENLTIAVREYREKTCLSALSTLKHLLSATTLKINTSVLQNLYTTVLSTMMELQTSKPSHPYTNNDCQAKLYEIFVAFYEQDTLKILPSLRITIDILNRGVNNSNRHIALTCEHGLSVLEKLCQPVCPSLLSPDIVATESEPETLFDDEVLDEVNNQMDTANENEEIGDRAEQIVETETDVNIKETIVESVTVTNQEETVTEVSPETLPDNKLIRILDVKVITTTVEEERTENSTIIDSTVGDSQVSNGGSNSEAKATASLADELNSEVNILKTEILANANITEEIPVSVRSETEKEGGEPPVKKFRLENESEENCTEVEIIKEEPTSFEEEDDRFEEDDAFVDEVKKY